MPYSIPIRNGIITMNTTDIKCPKCGEQHTYDDYGKQLEKSEKGLIYKFCKGCKIKMGITTNMEGDAVVWLKNDEKSKTLKLAIV